MAIGPYTKNNVNGSDNNDVTFWGFDEGRDETDLLRFRMSDEVIDAIKNTFNSLSIMDVETNDLAFKKGWNELLVAGDSGKKISSYIEFYKELFKDVEIIPYIYPMKRGVELPTSGNYKGQQKSVMSSAFQNKVSPLSGAGILVDTWFNNEIKNEDNSIMNVEASSSYNMDNVDGAEAEKCRYIMIDMSGGGAIKNQFLMKKTDSENIVTMPKFLDMYGLTSGNTIKAFKIENESDLYSTPSTLINFNSSRKTWGFLDRLTEPGVSGFTPNPVTLCGGLYTYNNINDDEISATNQRSTIMQRFEGYAVENNTPSSTTPNQNSYFFFVKVRRPWYNYNPVGEPSLAADFPEYMYFAFNINALFMPVNGGGYSAYYNRKLTSPYKNYWYPDTDNAEEIPGGYTGLPMVAYTRYVTSGWGNYQHIPYYLYLPFAYYLSKTSYFVNSEVYGFGITNKEVNWPGFTTAAESASTRCGLAIAASIDKWENFFRNGLGLWRTTTSKEELLNKPTSNWEHVPVEPTPPTPPTPEEEPGSGGQIAVTPSGGTGTGGGKDGGDAITQQSTQTGGGRVSNQWAMTGHAVMALQECLVNDNIWDAVKTLFKSDYKQGMINLLQFPFDVTTLFPSIPALETVKILGQNMDFTGISYFCNGYKVPKDITTSVTWATFDIKERFGSFLDYTGTSIDLYMPFIGHINLTPPAVMGRRIKVIYDIDFGDGSVLGTVWATHNRNNWENPEGSGYYPVCSQSGQIGTIIPLGSSDGLKKTQQKTTAVAGLLLGAGVTAATGGAAAPLLVGTGLGTFNNLSNMPSYQSGGVVESNHTFSVSTDCILTITFPEVDIPSNYAKIAGYPTNLYTKLENLQGFTACDMVKTNNINCTESEAAEIKNLLAQGVVIS